jgi:hypothetical protein
VPIRFCRIAFASASGTPAENDFLISTLRELFAKREGRTVMTKKPIKRFRKAAVERRTKETDIKVRLSLDGKGIARIATDIPFLDHMLELFSKHGLFDLEIICKGDLQVDDHHSVEDVAICLGQAFAQALGDKAALLAMASRWSRWMKRCVARRGSLGALLSGLRSENPQAADRKFFG